MSRCCQGSTSPPFTTGASRTEGTSSCCSWCCCTCPALNPRVLPPRNLPFVDFDPQLRGLECLQNSVPNWKHKKSGSGEKRRSRQKRRNIKSKISWLRLSRSKQKLENGWKSPLKKETRSSERLVNKSGNWKRHKLLEALYLQLCPIQLAQPLSQEQVQLPMEQEAMRVYQAEISACYTNGCASAASGYKRCTHARFTPLFTGIPLHRNAK